MFFLLSLDFFVYSEQQKQKIDFFKSVCIKVFREKKISQNICGSVYYKI